MKKIFIVLSIIIAVVVAIPFLGNKVVESSIENRIEVLTSYGLIVKESNTQSSYLSTKKHFIFVVGDSDKFTQYLNQYADTQLPAYIDALIDGAEIGFDIAYSNIAINDSIAIDIYPYALASKLVADIKSEDAEFYAYIDALLKDKKISYHLNYDVLDNAFDGYIKDIDESYSAKNDSKVSLLVKDAKFFGQGLLIAPETLSTNIEKLYLNLDAKMDKMGINLDDFTSTSVFESKTTYATTIKLKQLSWSAQSADVPSIGLDIQKFAFDFSSNTQGAEAAFYTKTSFDTMKINTKDVALNAEKFNYDLALRGVDKKIYSSLVSHISKSKIDMSPELEAQIQTDIIDLVAHGMVLEMADFSIKELSTLKNKKLGGMKIRSTFTFKEDENLPKKIALSPMALMQTMDVDLLFSMSDTLYANLSQVSPLFGMAQGFAKRDEHNVIFDIKLQNSSLSVNGKKIR